MLDKWNVFNDIEFVGILTYDTDSKEFSFDVKSNTEKAKEAIRCLNADKDQQWFKDTLFERVCPPNRVNIHEILSRYGMLEYDAWELLKHTNLQFVNDRVWMTKSMDSNEYYYKCMWGVCQRLEAEGRF